VASRRGWPPTGEARAAAADDHAQTSEFDDVAAWSAEVLAEGDGPTAVIGACRGSGSPSALAWLAEALELGPGRRLLDVGSGLGGPAAWAAARDGVRPVGAEPMEGAVRGASRLFGHPNVVAAADALPLPPASFDASWTLGVLDTVDRPDRLLPEVRRCLAEGGRFGALAYVAEAAIADRDLPEGYRFPTTDELVAAVEAAGFTVVDRAGPSAIPTPAGSRRTRTSRPSPICCPTVASRWSCSTPHAAGRPTRCRHDVAAHRRDARDAYQPPRSSTPLSRSWGGVRPAVSRPLASLGSTFGQFGARSSGPRPGSPPAPVRVPFALAVPPCRPEDPGGRS